MVNETTEEAKIRYGNEGVENFRTTVKVHLGRYSGTEFKIDDRKLRLIKESGILAIVEK